MPLRAWHPRKTTGYSKGSTKRGATADATRRSVCNGVVYWPLSIRQISEWSVSIRAAAGTFSNFDVSVADGVLKGTAKVASVQVKDPNPRSTPPTPDFFDAERYPELSFVSRSIARSGDELTIKGVAQQHGSPPASRTRSKSNFRSLMATPGLVATTHIPPIPLLQCVCCVAEILEPSITLG